MFHCVFSLLAPAAFGISSIQFKKVELKQPGLPGYQCFVDAGWGTGYNCEKPNLDRYCKNHFRDLMDKCCPELCGDPCFCDKEGWGCNHGCTEPNIGEQCSTDLRPGVVACCPEVCQKESEIQCFHKYEHWIGDKYHCGWPGMIAYCPRVEGDVKDCCPELCGVAETTTTTALPEASAEDDPHILATTGDKFDVNRGGMHNLLVIPASAPPQDADLHVSGQVRKHGPRQNDLWIKTLKIQGKWVKGGPYTFKTNNAAFNTKQSLLVRKRLAEWKSVDDFADPHLLVTSSPGKAAPKMDFEESIARQVEVQAGDVKLIVSYAAAQKSGDDVNHLDFHVRGLQSVKSDMGGLLAGKVDA